jgi:hypothetical protein
MGRHNKVNSCFSKFCPCANKWLEYDGANFKDFILEQKHVYVTSSTCHVFQRFIQIVIEWYTKSYFSDVQHCVFV